MGRASRRKQQRREGVEIDMTLFDAVLYQIAQDEKLYDEFDENGRNFHDLALATAREPDLRVVRFGPEQARALLATEWKDADAPMARELRPPFQHTFLEFGVPLPGRPEHAVGTFISAEPDLGRWAAVTFLVEAPAKEAHSWGSWCMLVQSPIVWSAEEPTHRLVFNALACLESVNVDLVEGASRGLIAPSQGIPQQEVIIRQSTRQRRYPKGHETTARDWSHRWETRGHPKHFRRGPIFQANAHKRIRLANGDEFVRVWCPPHIKGPPDKPFVPKIRTVRKEVGSFHG